MSYIVGFLVWIAVAALAGFLVGAFYRAPGIAAALTFVFAFLGAFIGGMLGVSGYIFHDPSPLRFGALLGAVLGAVFFPALYHYMARRFV
jgi:uncharacterized membrane protein YeaQ/YmgE (transglycosylase-associated protein family)